MSRHRSLQNGKAREAAAANAFPHVGQDMAPLIRSSVGEPLLPGVRTPVTSLPRTENVSLEARLCRYDSFWDEDFSVFFDDSDEPELDDAWSALAAFLYDSLR